MTHLKNLDILNINKHGRTYYGSDQEWYEKGIQRYSGCGPTVCANAVLYLSGRNKENMNGIDWRYIHGLMEDVWEYVTPGQLGVNSTKALAEGLLKYSESESIDLSIDSLDIDRSRKKRVDFGTLSAFLKKSFLNNNPVAFLNLSNGDINNLESWHWVLAVGLNDEMLTVYDQGKKKDIDLRKWLNTTLLGGGFVSIGKRDKLL